MDGWFPSHLYDLKANACHKCDDKCDCAATKKGVFDDDNMLVQVERVKRTGADLLFDTRLHIIGKRADLLFDTRFFITENEGLGFGKKRVKRIGAD